MSRTIQRSEPVSQLLKYCDEGAQLYWDPRNELMLWITGDVLPSDSPYIRIGGYEDFLEVSGLNTLENLPGDHEITAAFEIPDRRPGRPRMRTEPLERSAIDLPVSLWNELDEAKGSESRRAYIEAAVREKIEREKTAGQEAEEIRKAQEREALPDREYLYRELAPAKARARSPMKADAQGIPRK